jgi:predicted DNA-binding transcriptional regulator AlpA
METTASTTATGDKRRRGTKPQPLHVAQIADALLTMRTAAVVSGLSEATLYRKVKTDPTFPKLAKLGKRCTRIVSVQPPHLAAPT